MAHFWLMDLQIKPISQRDGKPLVHNGARERLDESCFETTNIFMPESPTIQRTRNDARAGKSPSTQADEFVREEFHHIREGIRLRPPARGQSAKVRRQAARDYEKGQHHDNGHVSRRRSRATLVALKREGHHAASARAISRQTHAAAQRRTSAERSASAKKAIRTKNRAGLSAAAHKAARTRISR
jgi:hypothetical protein